jgi:hypothetical protein
MNLVIHVVGVFFGTIFHVTNHDHGGIRSLNFIIEYNYLI